MSTPNNNQEQLDNAAQCEAYKRAIRNAGQLEQALAQEKANQEKIGATVQAARASATQLPAQGILADVRELLAYAKQLERERDDLQAQRDELLEACKAMRKALENVDFSPLSGVYDTIPFNQLDAAIARATEGGTGQ